MSAAEILCSIPYAVLFTAFCGLLLLDLGLIVLGAINVIAHAISNPKR